MAHPGGRLARRRVGGGKCRDDGARRGPAHVRRHPSVLQVRSDRRDQHGGVRRLHAARRDGAARGVRSGALRPHAALRRARRRRGDGGGGGRRRRRVSRGEVRRRRHPDAERRGLVCRVVIRARLKNVNQEKPRIAMAKSDL